MYKIKKAPGLQARWRMGGRGAQARPSQKIRTDSGRAGQAPNADAIARFADVLFATDGLLVASAKHGSSGAQNDTLVSASRSFGRHRGHLVERRRHFINHETRPPPFRTVAVRHHIIHLRGPPDDLELGAELHEFRGMLRKAGMQQFLLDCNIEIEMPIHQHLGAGLQKRADCRAVVDSGQKYSPC